MKFIILVSVFLLFSCNKDEPERITTNATIVWTGFIEVDGCDWCVKTDSVHYYHPDFLDTAFKHDQLDVRITYELTPGKFTCGFTEIQTIHVVDIIK